MVLTGVTSSGKTTLGSELVASLGYGLFVEEAARTVISKEGRSSDPLKRQQRIFEEAAKAYNANQSHDLVCYDRGPTDCVAYASLLDKTVALSMWERCQELHYDFVFWLEPLSFRADEVRSHDQQRRELLGDLHRVNYLNLGFEVIEVPVMPLSERVNYVEELLHDHRK